MWGSYLTLLPVGLAVPPLLPKVRWALTPPFHPYSQSERFFFCGAFRRVPPPGNYPAPLLRGVRTFLEDPSPRSSSLPHNRQLAKSSYHVNKSINHILYDQLRNRLKRCFRTNMATVDPVDEPKAPYGRCSGRHKSATPFGLLSLAGLIERQFLDNVH